MRDQGYTTLYDVDNKENLGQMLAPLTIEVPKPDLNLQIPSRLTRPARRKRRTRPATERFHGKVHH